MSVAERGFGRGIHWSHSRKILRSMQPTNCDNPGRYYGTSGAAHGLFLTFI
ncbi:hypothetical protein [Azospirillum argentinense]